MQPHTLLAWLLSQLIATVLAAGDAANTNTTSVKNGTTEQHVGWRAGPKERGTLTLVGSCLLTIFTCTWTVLHLNVGALDDSRKDRFTRQVKWMAITILLPEFIFSKAVCELRAALKDLHKFEQAIRDFHNNDLACKSRHDNGRYEIVRRWQVRYGPVVRRLFPVMGLPRPEARSTQTDAESGAARQSESEVKPVAEVAETNERQTQNVEAGIEIAGPEEQRCPSELSDEVPIQVHWRPQDWTLTHSYFANMGGLVYKHPDLHSDDSKHHVLTGIDLGQKFHWHHDEHPLHGLVLSQDDILDKSKADWFLRLLSILQILWLVLTLITRQAASLPLTQLELATLAFSIFAIATFAVSWWKPKDVARPVRLIGRGESAEPKRDYFNPSQSFVLRLISPVRARKASEKERRMHRVPNDMVEMQGRVPLMFKTMAVSAFVFGGIHCLAWNFTFSSQAETMLWRIVTVASTVIPIISLAISIFYNRRMFKVEYSAMKALEPKLRPLNSFPEHYMDMLTDPYFWRSGWTMDQRMALCWRPDGKTRNFSRQPTVEDIASFKKTRDWEKYQSVSNQALNFSSALGTFFDAWKEVQKGGEGLFQLDFLFREHGSLIEYFSKEVEDFYVDYENSFVKAEAHLDQENSPNITVVTTIAKDARKLLEHTLRRAQRDEMLSTWMVFCSAIFYIAARIILIVLLFSSLRSVSPRVYEETPWTRFLPKWS